MTLPSGTETLAVLAWKGPLKEYPWHLQQKFALASSTNVVVILGGNQSGKTQAAMGVVSRLVRREGPIYNRLRNPVGRPLRIWVSPQLTEKYRSNWEARLIHQVFAGMDFDYVQSPHPVFTWRDEYGGGELWGKSQEQGFLAFESDAVDLVVFDEEPGDRRLFTSAEQRLATTNGIILFAFTPLLGISWSHGTFYVPTVKPQYQMAPRVWRRGNGITLIQMGMGDNPASVAGGGVARIQHSPSMTQAEKNTRLLGEYGYAEGLIFPQFADLDSTHDSNPYLIPALPKDRPYSWVLTADPNRRHGGLLVAIDHQENRYYVAEHYAEGLPDSQHAAAYLQMLASFKLRPNRDVGIFADPGGSGSQAIINMAEVGLFAQPVPKDAGSVKASIERIRRAAWIDPAHRHPLTGAQGAPHCYFLASLRSRWTLDGVEYQESRLMWELRQYRQKEGGKPDEPVKEKDDVIDCMRYVELVRPFAPAAQDMTVALERAKLDSISRKAAEEFDLLAKKANEKRPMAEVW